MVSMQLATGTFSMPGPGKPTPMDQGGAQQVAGSQEHRSTASAGGWGETGPSVLLALAPCQDMSRQFHDAS
jgi:hypothetical protein